MQHGIVLAQKFFWGVPGKTLKISDKMHLIEIIVAVSDVRQFGIIGIEKLIQGILKAIQYAVSLCRDPYVFIEHSFNFPHSHMVILTEFSDLYDCITSFKCVKELPKAFRRLDVRIKHG